MRTTLMAATAALAVVAYAAPGSAGTAEAEKWVNEEFQPSTLSKEEQMKEMEWFIKAAEPFVGMEINVLSEGPLPTHDYESTVLTKAFEEITGIKVNHQELGEGEVVQAVQTQMQTNRNIYDAYINDSDLIGTHSRLQSAVNLTDWMKGEGKSVTLPTLDVRDFIGISFTTGPDGKVWQLPDQQFANLYWFRYDWFKRPDLRAKFKAKYGYELGVPVNWSAYEDIAEFFSEDVKTIDGKRIYGHMDYGKRAPDLGWRMTDAWRPAGARELRLGLAGLGSMGRNHLRILSSKAGSRLAGVADPVPDVLAPAIAGTGAEGFADPLAMIREAGLDGVVIAAPTNAHLTLALAAIECGVPVLVEKPLAGTVDDALRIVHAATERGVPVQVGHVERFNPAVLELGRLLQAGWLSTVYAIVSRRAGPPAPSRTRCTSRGRSKPSSPVRSTGSRPAPRRSSGWRAGRRARSDSHRRRC